MIPNPGGAFEPRLPQKLWKNSADQRADLWVWWNQKYVWEKLVRSW
jgi:hypothetical protein